jgi:hypothetical protein
VKTRRGAGKRKAIKRAKQPAKAAGQSNAESRGERPHKETQSRGKSRTANLPDRIAPWGSYPTNDFVAELLSDIRDEVKGLRGDLQLLIEECRTSRGATAEVNLFESDARGTRPGFPREQDTRSPDERRNGEAAGDANPSHSYGTSPRQPPLEQGVVGGEHVSGVPGSSPPREKEVLADYDLLRQQTEFVDPDSGKVRRVSTASLETLLVKMLRSNAYQDAEHPTQFAAAQLENALDGRTYRAARALLRNNDFISATTSTRTKKMNRLHGGEETVQEYWDDVCLTGRGVALARHIDSLGLPHLKHMDSDSNKAEAVGTATGSADGPEEKT